VKVLPLLIVPILLVVAANIFLFSKPSALNLTNDNRTSVEETVRKDCEKEDYRFRLDDSESPITITGNVAMVGAVCLPENVNGTGYVAFLKRFGSEWKILERISGPVPSLTKTQKETFEKEGIPSDWYKDFIFE